MRRVETPSTDKVLAFIKSELARKNRFPASSEIRDHMGWKTDSGVSDTLMRLCIRGDLVRRKNYDKSRKHNRYEYLLGGIEVSNKEGV